MATSAAGKRRRTVIRPQAVQKRLAFGRARRGQSIRGPTVARITGSRVVATSTLTSGISMPPMPTLRRKGTGITTSESRPMATVEPLKTTAVPAVSIARCTAAPFSRPLARSSRQRSTISSE